MPSAYEILDESHAVMREKQAKKEGERNQSEKKMAPTGLPTLKKLAPPVLCNS